MFDFVSLAVHQAVREELAAERATNAERAHALDFAQAQVEFLMLRVNQLEKERAILFKEVTSLPIPVPEIVSGNPIATSADRLLKKQIEERDLWKGLDDGSITQ
jgi:hypothetical protein